MMRWLLYIAVGLGALIAIVTIIGALLPKGHRATRAAVYRAAPDVVFELLRDVEHYPDWREGVSKVDLLASDGGGARFREHSDNGVVTYRVEAVAPPRMMRTRIADSSLAFGGSWTFELATTATGGTSLTITEDGEVYNPIFRFMSKFFFSPTGTIEKFQRSLAKKLGE